jgi:signal peptidase II
MDEPQSQTASTAPLPGIIRRLCLIIPLTTIGVALDLCSKAVVFDWLGYPGGQGRIYCWLGQASTFRLFTSFNEGALWGIGQGLTWMFAALSFVAVAVIVYCLLKTSAGQSHWLTVALCLVLSGTLGNLYDRLGLYGYRNPETGQPYRAVRDFLLFTFGDYSWPVFNFADVFLVTGTGMLVAYSFWAEHHAAKLANHSTVPATE